MTIRTVTYDDATHVVVLREPTEEITVAIEAEIDKQLLASGMHPLAMCRQDGADVYAAMIAAAPPFTSLPNPDLDVIEAALNIAQGYIRSQIVDSLHYMNEEKKCDLSDVIQAIAALKRIKGE